MKTTRLATDLYIAGLVYGAVLLGALACVGSRVKPTLRTVDASITTACETLAPLLAEHSGADAARIIASTCAVEGFTRTLRELLLSQQINAAQRAGVAVPSLTSGALEDAQPQLMDAE